VRCYVEDGIAKATFIVSLYGEHGGAKYDVSLYFVEDVNITYLLFYFTMTILSNTAIFFDFAGRVL
jgi:hypothetical protein